MKRKQRSDNTSGHTGVYKMKNGRYRTGIGFKGKRYSLGTYDTFAEAVKAREYAENVLHKAFINEYDQWQAGVIRTKENETPKPERPVLIARIAGPPIERILTAAMNNG